MGRVKAGGGARDRSVSKGVQGGAKPPGRAPAKHSLGKPNPGFGGGGGGGGGFGGGSDMGGGAPVGGSGGYDFSQADAYGDEGGPSGGTVPCSKCGRSFGEDRIDKHERACKGAAKPKKVKLFHKPISDKEKARMDNTKAKSSKWRQQHDDFVQAMKYNRKMNAVEARGGDIRNMPPPPRTVDPSLVPCPHCGRRFGETQAARHIPACKNTVNKPKPPPRATGGYGSSSRPSGGMGGGTRASGGMGGGFGSSSRPSGGMGGGASNYRRKF